MNLTDLFILHQQPVFVNTFFEISQIFVSRNAGVDERRESAPQDAHNPAAAVGETVPCAARSGEGLTRC